MTAAVGKKRKTLKNTVLKNICIKNPFVLVLYMMLPFGTAGDRGRVGRLLNRFGDVEC